MPKANTLKLVDPHQNWGNYIAQFKPPLQPTGVKESSLLLVLPALQVIQLRATYIITSDKRTELAWKSLPDQQALVIFLLFGEIVA